MHVDEIPHAVFVRNGTKVVQYFMSENVPLSLAKHREHILPISCLLLLKISLAEKRDKIVLEEREKFQTESVFAFFFLILAVNEMAREVIL